MDSDFPWQLFRNELFLFPVFCFRSCFVSRGLYLAMQKDDPGGPSDPWMRFLHPWVGRWPSRGSSFETVCFCFPFMFSRMRCKPALVGDCTSYC